MAAMTTPDLRTNFIREIIDEDLRTGRHDRVVTRFPPEPNGYLHIGHAKSICLNFGLARDYGGACHLRMDDTNPETEDQHFVDAIQNDVRWLGFDWGDKFFHAADYFDRFYEAAEHLVRAGKAYVDHSTVDEIRDGRGSLSEPGKPSKYRERSVEENLDLLRRMRAGEFADGESVLRAKIDLASPNMKMRDPLLYRIRHTPHHRTGDRWPIYPMYDFAHPLSDAYEGITHSICTLEFENNRELYDWVIDNCPVPARPHQYEFARLQLGYTVLSKRKLLRLVTEKYVSGWDDPRMPTIAGLRRRGYTPEAMRAFCDLIGVAKTNSTVDIGKLEFAIRDDLNHRAPRVMAVLRPLRVVVTNWPEGKAETIDAPFFPPEVGREGSRPVPFGRELFIERDDFAEQPPKGFFRLAPGQEVRLRHAYVIRCDEVVKDPATGEVTELRCTADLDSIASGRRVKGTIHWVSAAHAVPAEVRLYDRLFTAEKPDLADDFLAVLNPDSLEVLRGCLVEPAVKGEGHYQFERQGYFYADPVDSKGGALVFNRVVTLRDSWAAKAAEPAAPEAPRAPKAKKETRPTKKSAAEIRARVRSDSPTLSGRYSRYTEVLKLAEEDADVLTGDRALSDFFEAALGTHKDARSVANWTVNELQGLLKDRPVTELPFDGATFGRLVALVDGGTVSSTAGKEVLAALVERGGDPAALVEQLGLTQLSDDSALAPIVDAVVAEHPDHVARYRAGNAGLLGFFVGQVMRRSGGKADPRRVNELLRARLG
jgi:glutaminyl-tRNA synthetase